ncbi:MAG: cold-shock protein [Thermoplasmata archaeon]|nr:MAG: cold-shock protein [Thermoplasmata archaeon]
MPIRGTVKWFSNAHGWGFIRREGASDVFLHHSRILGKGFKVLRRGDPVVFTVKRGRKGPYAVEVKLAASDTAQRRASRQGRR